jgi:DNA-binding transcriptional LysR family regulator
MELRHLRYFTAVAETLHFGRAAARLNISAPTLSHQIGALETTLGAKLFTRRTKSAVGLTHAGKRFLVEAHETLRQAERAELIGRRAGRGDTGSITIGYVMSAICGGLLSTSLANYREKHPDVSFALQRTQTVEQFRNLIDGSLDIGFARLPYRYPGGLAGFLVDKQKYYLGVPLKHPLAGRKQVTPAMLEAEPFVATSLEMEIGFWSNTAAIAPPGVTLQIVDRAPDVISMMALSAAGAGICVVSESLTRVAIPGLVFCEITGTTRTSDHVVVYRKNEGAPVVKGLINYLRSNVKLR